jgi:xanthine dehydrogenase accessory factor
MATLANGLGWRTAIVDDEGGSLSDHSVADEVWNSLDLKASGVNSGSYVVVATLGHYDEDALEAALATDAAYIGLVASKKRAGTVMEFLKGNGVAEEQLARIKAPAGLDLGRIKHEEMAVAVIAEIVQRKAVAGNPGTSSGPMHNKAETAPTLKLPVAEPKPAKASKPAAESNGAASPAPRTAAAASVPVEGPAEAIDPVCDMTVTVKGARYHTEHEGQTYYFCCPACRKLFQDDPDKYLKVKQQA